VGRYSNNGWGPYVSVAERRAKAAATAARLTKAGRVLAPVTSSGRKVAKTFWGVAWCNNLEAYSDYANRLPRGRSYVGNGLVIDLQLEAGHIRALVSGSELYTVSITVAPLVAATWDDIKQRCAGQISSLVELLQGSISSAVMQIVSHQGAGLFPTPHEIKLKCSCPDGARMCKHVAATLYGVGARLDAAPEQLFTLRGVDASELVAAAVAQPASPGRSRRGRTIASDDLSSVFGIDIDLENGGDGAGAAAPTTPEAASAPSKPARKTRRKT